MKVDRLLVYRDNVGDFRWRYIASNGRIMADSGEGYRRRIDCERAAQRFTGLEPERLDSPRVG